MQTIAIDPTFYTSAPKDTNRLEKEMRTYELLDRLSIPYVRLDHDVTATVESCLEIEKMFEIEICKNLFLTNSQKSNFYLLMMLGNKKLRTAELTRQLVTSRLSFAEESYMEEFLDLTPGSVTVLGLMNDKEQRVQLLIDRDLLTQEYIGCHPCINTSSLKIKFADLLDKFLPSINHTPIIVELSQ